MTPAEMKARIDFLEGVALPHARKQANAEGFQKGWHAALARIRHGDSAEELAAICPQPIEGQP